MTRCVSGGFFLGGGGLLYHTIGVVREYGVLLILDLGILDFRVVTDFYFSTNSNVTSQPLGSFGTLTQLTVLSAFLHVPQLLTIVLYR